MRLAAVILGLAAIAIGLVHLRRERTQVRHELQLYRNRQIQVRRDLWDQQVQLGWLQAPAEIRRRADQMALQLTEKAKAPGGLIAGSGGASPPNTNR